MIERDDGVVAGLGDVLVALDFKMIEGAEDDGEEVDRPARRHGTADGDSRQKVGDADDDEQRVDAEAELLQHRLHERTDHHERGVEHVDAGDHTGAAVGMGPRLHRGEGRHHEQTAADGEPSEVDGNANAARPGKIAFNAERRGGGHEMRDGPGEIEREQPEQNGTEQRRQDDDPPGGEPCGQAGTERHRDREDGQEECDEPIVAVDADMRERQ